MTTQLQLINIIIIDMNVSCHRPFLPGTSLEPAVIPTAHLQASHCSTFRIMCDVPSTAVFCSELLLLLLLLLLLKSGRMRWEGRRVHRVLVGKPEGNRPLGRPRRRREDNIKMDILEVGGGCGD